MKKKSRTYSDLQDAVNRMPTRESCIVAGDLNGYIREGIQGNKEVIGCFSIGNRNAEGERIVDFCTRSISIIIYFFHIPREATNGHGIDGIQTMKHTKIYDKPGPSQ